MFEGVDTYLYDLMRKSKIEKKRKVKSDQRVIMTKRSLLVTLLVLFNSSAVASGLKVRC